MNKKKGICQLIIGVLVIGLVVGFIVPYINQSSTNEVMLFVNKNNFDTGILFYTESEEGLEAIDRIQLQSNKNIN